MLAANACKVGLVDDHDRCHKKWVLADTSGECAKQAESLEGNLVQRPGVESVS
jgi:hypothetical protein